MNTVVEAIQKTGIFLIAAQALIHFAPGTAYAKYMKLLMGIMVLLLLLSPAHQLITDDIILLPELTDRYEMFNEQSQTSALTMSWTEMEAYIENHSWKQENVLNRLEEEIKSRLNEEVGKMLVEENLNAQEENKEYSVASVTINETEPPSLRIVLYRKASVSRTDNKSMIQISDIVITEDRRNAENDMPNNIASDIEKDTINHIENDMIRDDQLNIYFEQKFADILGVKSEQVEVIVYGADW